jgi:hypothetical protein
MEMEQMFACLLKEMKDEMLAKIETSQTRTESAQKEMNAKMDTQQEKLEAAVNSMRAWRKEMKAN